MIAHRTRASELSPEPILLGLLEAHPAHGYELHLRLTRDLGGLWHLSQSQVYSSLKRLEARGWIASTAQLQPHLPDRRKLRLTAEGRRRFHAWLRTPTPSSVRAIRVDFLSRLYFADRQGPQLIARLIEDQTRSVEADLRRLGASRERSSESTIGELAQALRLRQLASLLPWLDECRQLLIETGTSGDANHVASTGAHRNPIA
jgi:DNA-binding PadR family transcriptional regulator